MANTSEELYNEMLAMRSRLPRMNPIAPGRTASSVETDLLTKAKNFLPQYERVGQLEAEAFAAPETTMKRYDKTYGKGVGKGLGLGSETGGTLMDQGRRYSAADTARRSVETQKLSLQDLARTIYETEEKRRQDEQMNNDITNQNFGSEFDYLSKMYGLQFDREQAAKAGSGGGASNGGFEDIFNTLNSLGLQTGNSSEQIPSGFQYGVPSTIIDDETGEIVGWTDGYSSYPLNVANPTSSTPTTSANKPRTTGLKIKPQVNTRSSNMSMKPIMSVKPR